MAASHHDATLKTATNSHTTSQDVTPNSVGHARHARTWDEDVGCKRWLCGTAIQRFLICSSLTAGTLRHFTPPYSACNPAYRLADSASGVSGAGFPRRTLSSISRNGPRSEIEYAAMSGNSLPLVKTSQLSYLKS